MLYVNLISEKLKKELKLRRAYGLIKKISLVFIFVTIFISAIFLATKFTMFNNFDEVNKQVNLTPIDGQNYNVKVKEINNKISAISKIQNEFIPYSKLIKNITSVIPAGITLSYLKIDSEKKAIKIRGRAEERDNLLQLEENLSKLTFFYDVDLPLKSMLEKIDINFEINVKLDLAKLPNSF